MRIPLVYSATSPQTGLDAANAHHIVQLLKDLAGEGRTVIVAIHTPRPEIWELFDHILLLSQGHVLYNGSTSSIRGYFERCGHAISASENPAEHLIDLVSIEAEAEGSPMGSVARINNLKEQWKAAQRTVADNYAPYSNNGSVVRYGSAISRHPAVPLSRQLATPRGHLYGCTSVTNPPTGECTGSYGKDIISSLGIPREWIWQPVVASLGFLVSYTLVAALILQRPRMGAVMTSDPQSSHSSVVIQNMELLPLSSTPHTPGVDIQLTRYALILTRRNIKAFLGPSYERPILKPVNTIFRHGELSIIMGPSGSGKTTLLHAITARLPQRYRRQGQVFYNSHRLRPSTIRAMCSYVSQSDNLQPFLTVRETLLFAAGLRLPRWITKEQRYSKVDSIIRTMGLTSCAETIVGDRKQKGISGGEKRRVSIGIQLLTDPRILILDEPTSGLDV
ncbi:unnamed protein product [Aspergillus oryzae]|nr:unnamed protein product [Aspergillus oryzae]